MATSETVNFFKRSVIVTKRKIHFYFYQFLILFLSSSWAHGFGEQVGYISWDSSMPIQNASGGCRWTAPVQITAVGVENAGDWVTTLGCGARDVVKVYKKYYGGEGCKINLHFAYDANYASSPNCELSIHKKVARLLTAPRYLCNDYVKIDSNIDIAILNLRVWTPPYTGDFLNVGNSFGMQNWESAHWDNYYDQARMLNSLYVLKNAPANNGKDYKSQNVLYGAYDWIAARTDRLKPVCSFSDAELPLISLPNVCKTENGVSDACNIRSYHGDGLSGFQKRQTIEFLKKPLFEMDPINRAAFIS